MPMQRRQPMQLCVTRRVPCALCSAVRRDGVRLLRRGRQRQGEASRASRRAGISKDPRFYITYAQSAAELLKIDGGCGVAPDILAGCGVLLVTRHAGDGVIKNDDGGAALVVHYVHKPGYAGVQEGGIAYYGYGAGGVDGPGAVQPVGHGDAGTHADAGIDGAKRRGRAEGVAADIAHDGKLHFAQGIEHGAVRAAGAKHRRTGGQGVGLVIFRHGAAQRCGYHGGAVFALKGEELLAAAGDAQGENMLLDNRLKAPRRL